METKGLVFQLDENCSIHKIDRSDRNFVSSVKGQEVTTLWKTLEGAIIGLIGMKYKKQVFIDVACELLGLED